MLRYIGQSALQGVIGWVIVMGLFEAACFAEAAWLVHQRKKLSGDP